MKTKFSLYEIVKVIVDKKYDGMFNEEIGYISKIYPSSRENLQEYDVDLNYETPQKFVEDELESLCGFLIQTEINEIEKRNQIENNFNKYEIVTIIKFEDSQYLNREAYIYDMIKSYHTGNWSYKIRLVGNDDTDLIIEESKIERTGRSLSLEEIDNLLQREQEKLADEDEVIPLTWQEEKYMDYLYSKAYKNMGHDWYNRNISNNVRVMFGCELSNYVHCKWSKSYIGAQAYESWTKCRFDNEDVSVSELLYSLSVMEHGEEFERSYKELDEIARALIFGGDLKRWI